jgi:signal transduction histidine kinase
VKKSSFQGSKVVLLTKHQVYTPLTVIKGYVSLIQEGNYGKIPKKVKKALAIIDKSASNLVDTVEDAVNPHSESKIAHKFL